MATRTYMIEQIKAFTTRLINAFSRTKGAKDHVFYVDNNEGVFSFAPGFAITVRQIGTTVAEVALAKTSIAQNYPNGGTTLLNSHLRIVEELDPATKTWSKSEVSYFDHVKQLRVYYSPWSRRIWAADKYGDLKRLMIGTMTEIG